MMDNSTISKELAFRDMLTKMSIQPEYPDYSSADYWNKRYTNERGQSHEWLQDYESLRPFILQKLGQFHDSEILNIGCGNSRFAELLYKDGFKNITNIDFSPVVIQEMTNKYATLDEMEYTNMDALNIQFDSSCFDFVFDKGTFDCIMSSEFDPERKANIMLDNAYRVLKDKGEFIMLTIGKPDENLKLLKHARLNWVVQVFELDKPTVPVFKGFEDEEFHYMYICGKGK